MDTLSLNHGGGFVVKLKANEILEKLKAKTEQMWQLAASNACGKQTAAVAHIQHDIQRLFSELQGIIDEQDCSNSCSGRQDF